MPHETIFDGADILVSADLRPTGTVVFAFNNFAGAGGPRDRFGDGFLQKAGFSAILFVSKNNHWWQTPDLEPALAAANEAARGYAHRVSYGPSMGGYGALLTASALGARPVAFSAQTVISDPGVGMFPGWLEEIAKRPVLRDDVRVSLAGAAGATLIYDPRDAIDAAQVRALSAAVETVTLLKIPFATHSLLTFLKQANLIGSLVPRLLDDNISPAEFRTIVRSRRALSPLYVFALLSACRARGRKGLMRLILRAVEPRLGEIREPALRDRMQVAVDFMRAKLKIRPGVRFDA